jgi:hypothetical protein
VKFRSDVEAWFWRDVLLSVAAEAPRRAWRDCIDFADFALLAYRERIDAFDPNGNPEA